ncbi:DUF4377 domain-containing protein [Myroides phaeus]|uniref:DUF4377 domain-containing protein n=1 Tax=Myroides phaeus TaxID=702745 RepID=UPI002DB839C9|nr:DUF4377 domain-containing protein [Myroides phaeus]MEC4117659.1 DUF4377 domain-containing protein [Myroides phaeus]
MKNYLITTSVFVAMLASCSTSDDNNTITTKEMNVEVQPYVVMMSPGPFGGTQEIPHLVLIEEKTNKKHYTPGIEGFDYKEGTKYKLRVKFTLDKSITDSGGTYKLIKIIK